MVSPTVPWFFAGLLAVQSGTETQILNQTMLLRRYRGTCNLEASLHGTSTDFPHFGFPRGNTQNAGTRNANWTSTHKSVFNSSLFHYIGHPHTRPRCWTFWWWLMPPTAYHCSCESLTALRRSTAWFTQAKTSVTTCERDTVFTWLHGSKTALFVILSQIEADSVNLATPESEKKFHWVKCGFLTKSCTQSRAPRTSSSQIMTRSTLMTNPSPEIAGPRTMRAVNT